MILAATLAWPAGSTADPAAIGGDDPYFTELVVAARKARLHEDRYWHILLHYQSGLLGTRSLVDDPAFFASPRGNRDAAAELEATLRAFFEQGVGLPGNPTEEAEADDAAVDGATGGGDSGATGGGAASATGDGGAAGADTLATKSGICRFPARFTWLAEKLAIDRSRLPAAQCDRFEQIYAEIAPTNVSLIFPTAHMNSPASMYGHTLLTIGSGEGETALLSHAINYSAVTNETFGPLYIAKGLLGLYPGYFSMLPYYAKLQEYSDVNDRDIWEYRLDFTPEEIRRLLLHLFELENIDSRYYFFGENCSYHLLFLLEAARPSLELTDAFGAWVIPLDTVRQAKAAGLVAGSVYRPSKSTKISHLATLLPEDARREARAIARGELEPSAVVTGTRGAEEKLRIVDLASEYLQYLHAKGEIDKDTYVPRFLRTLEARSHLTAPADWRDDLPEPPRPEDGHLSARVSLGATVSDGEVRPEIALRPAYHDLLDTGPGFDPGAQIVFLEGVLRFDPESAEVHLQRLDAIDIVSLAPRDLFFPHQSWKVGTGLYRRRTEEGREALVFRLGTGFGWAYEAGAIGLAYAMVEADGNLGGALDRSFALGGGGSVGFLASPTERWKLHLTGRGILYRFGDQDERYEVWAGQSLGFGATTNVSVEFGAIREREETREETRIGARLYF